MQGRQCLFVLTLALALGTSCSSNSLMKPDCHSCTVEEQEWTGFSWNALVGKWKGSVENMKNNETSAKKQKVDK